MHDRDVPGRSVRGRAGCAVVALLFGTACGEAEETPGRASAAPVLRFSAAAPLSLAGHIVLFQSDMACGIESYETRVYCLMPDGDPHMLGREGEGPGEFRWITEILRGPDGTLGVLDGELNRLSLVDPVSGVFVSETPMPQQFMTSSPLEATVSGRYHHPGVGWIDAEVDATTGRILWERSFTEDILECGVLQSSGRPTSRGGLVFVACRGEYLIWFAHRDAGEPAAIIPVPTFIPRFPNSEDVALYARRSWGRPPTESEIERYRTTTKRWYGQRLVDEQDRLWAISHWEAGDVVPDSSYLDVYDVGSETPAYLGAVQLRHKVVGFDILGETLVVLVDRPVRPSDPAGIPQRGVDWYRLADAPLGTEMIPRR